MKAKDSKTLSFIGCVSIYVGVWGPFHVTQSSYLYTRINYDAKLDIGPIIVLSLQQMK